MKKVTIFLIWVCLVGCKSSIESIETEQMDFADEVYFRMYYDEYLKRNVIRYINIPYIVKLKNDNVSRKKITRITYNYGYSSKMNRGGRTKIYELDNQLFRPKKINGTLTDYYLDRKQEKILKFTTYHRVTDTTKYNNEYFKSYINKMVAQNIDSISVGTVLDFIIEHPELSENILLQNQIFIRYQNTNLKENDAPTSKMYIPVKFKY